MTYICRVKNYFRLLTNLRNYKGHVSLNILFNLISIIFSLFSLTMIIPFLNVLFKITESSYQPKPWSFSVNTILNNFNYYLSDYIRTNGELRALALIAVLVI